MPTGSLSSLLPEVLPLLGDASSGEMVVAASGPDLAALAVYTVVALAVGVVLLVASELIGPRRRDPEKATTYECGVPLFDTAREPFTIKFYLVAILFILFDIETVFLIPYAVIFKELGLIGLIEMGAFLLVLAGGLVYCWRRGALEWD
jgi:NADH-quinone oxidoreductase subunit A